MSSLLTPPAATKGPIYSPAVEEAIAGIQSLLAGEYGLAPRAVALLLLQGDADIAALVRQHEGERADEIAGLVRKAAAHSDQPLAYSIAMSRQATTESILAETVSFPEDGKRSWSEILSRLTINPITGFPILFAVLYFGLYQFVGMFGAGTLVGLLENDLFGGIINPWVTRLVEGIIPWPALQSLFVGDYGIVTLAITYAIALILPIVGTFFLVFSVIEDSGYLPRLALLLDRAFKAVGLNGRAVIPLVLGLGCGTMATVVTRVLETRRERVLATLLMALAIPCSAQLGVVLGLLSFNAGALLLWAGVIGVVFLLVGLLAARLVPGEKPSFYVELPPLRWPQPGNVLAKTYARMEWYFLEVLPVFVLASVIVWLGQLIGVFDVVVAGLQPAMQLLGLPKEAAVVFLFGFFRRDYGAAGLYTLAMTGAIGGVQIVVAAVTLTLFVPCIAQFSVMLKERGPRTTLAIVAFVFPFAFAVGFILKTVLMA
ncbi:MAG: ferrous iron transporter B, partial [Dehalococcoidales bacterium]|nr:ferrous iron transporter B [Dehalococcoidales bacterium]